MIVVDSSFLLALITPDTRRAFVINVLNSGAGELAAPLLMPFEVVHVLSRKFGGGDITLSERNLAISDLEAQFITYDQRPGFERLERIATLGAEHHLSGYDASYLELALRIGAELGTLDGDLAKAARRSGLVVHHA